MTDANAPSWKTNPRCDEAQLAMLRRCSEAENMAEWSDRREAHPDEAIWLQGGDLKHAHLDGADLLFAHLEGANLEEAHLKGADIRRARLEGAELSAAHLEGADFRRADLGGAAVRKARLEGADLRRARLEGADLYEARLEGADLSFAAVDGGTLFAACTVDRKTNFTGVGLGACRVDPGLKQALEYNIRRIHWHSKLAWYNPFKWLPWPFWVACDYGRSMTRIVIVFLVLSLLFAGIYYRWPDLVVTNDGEALVSPTHAVYFSVVTMTTLGFGDIHASPDTPWGQKLLMAQVILGYVLLGGVICRLAILFQSTGPPQKFSMPLWRRLTKWVAVIAICVGCYFGWRPWCKWVGPERKAGLAALVARKREAAGEYYHVLRVIDGDTFVIRYDGEPTSVRLWGIDAPERTDPDGLAAAAELRRLIDDRQVRLVLPGPRKRDNFGCLLARVYVDDVEVSQAMLAAGLVATYERKRP